MASTVADTAAICPTGTGDAGVLSRRVVGRLSGALYTLCGSLVLVAAPWLPFAPGARRPLVMGVAVVAVVSGIVIWVLPWQRWDRRASLWVMPLALILVGAHNAGTGGDGFLYAAFYIVAFTWLGLGHPPGTSLRFAPMLVAAYLVPLASIGQGWSSMSSAVYVVPATLLVGETVAWVAGRLRRSETALRASVERLSANEQTFRQLFSSNPQPMWVHEADSLRLLEVNEAAIGYYGYGRHEFLRMSVPDLLWSDDAARFGAAHHEDAGAAHPGRSWRHRTADGRQVEVEVSWHRLSFRGIPAALVSVQDVTERNALEEQLRHQAFHDGLTDLANRALFHDRVSHAITRRHREGECAVLLLDLDGFKTINDSLGHSFGDELLVAVADRLRGCLRSEDTAARLGGDEFAVLVEDVVGVDSVLRVAGKIGAALQTPFVLAGREVFAPASIGIALSEGPDGTAEGLIRDADAAMYAAKATGKGGCALFEPAMRAAAMRRLEADAELRVALRQDQLFLAYQPKVRLEDGAVLGVEALIRWDHPVRGVVMPGEFVRLAEESGVIVEVGEWVLREACARLAAWQESRPDFTVAVNLSARQLAEPDLPAAVARALDDTGARPGGLILELTESQLMGDTDAARDALIRLKALGVRLALDDFGTGYSSLSYLRSFPIDELKIDRSFVSGLDGGDDASVVAGIIRLSEALGLTTVAEGVETDAQAGVLARLGCREAQGYLWSRPVPASELDRLLAAVVAPAPG